MRRSGEPRSLAGSQAHVARSTAAAILTLAVLLTASSAGADDGGAVELISVTPLGQAGNDESAGPAISADGSVVAFSSRATDLAPGDGDDYYDVFVRDRRTGTTTRLDTEVAGTDGTLDQAVSANGRFVAYTSVFGVDVPLAHQVDVLDRQTGATERVSLTPAGDPGSLNSGLPALSATGRFVAFESLASDIVAADRNSESDVFVRDRETGVSERVSVSSTGAEANGGSGWSVISADGRFVAFYSRATNLVPSDTNYWIEAFVHDRQTGVTDRISVGSLGTGATGQAVRLAISADGRYVAFTSERALEPADTNVGLDVYLRDRQLGTTELISVDDTGKDIGGSWPSMSADGRYVGFSNIDGMYVRDRQTATTTVALTDSSGQPVDAVLTAMNPDASLIAFDSWQGLVPDDTNSKPDVYIAGRATPPPPAGVISLIPRDATAAAGGSHSVTAHLLTDEAGTPIVAAKIGFRITGVNSAATGVCDPAACVTDETGRVEFTYRSNGAPGSDAITAFYDLNGNNAADAGEAQTNAAMQWTPGDPACSRLYVVGVRGSGETNADYQGYGRTIWNTITSFGLNVAPLAIERTYLDYPSNSVEVLWKKGVGKKGVVGVSVFLDGVDIGIDALIENLERQVGACPQQKIVLFGYSQGALVINQTLRRLGFADSPIVNHIVGVGLIADPHRLGSAAYTVGSADRGFNGISRTFAIYPAADLPPRVAERAVSWCDAGDYVCAFNWTLFRIGRTGAVHGAYWKSAAFEVGATVATIVESS